MAPTPHGTTRKSHAGKLGIFRMLASDRFIIGAEIRKLSARHNVNISQRLTNLANSQRFDIFPSIQHLNNISVNKGGFPYSHELLDPVLCNVLHALNPQQFLDDTYDRLWIIPFPMIGQTAYFKQVGDTAIVIVNEHDIILYDLLARVVIANQESLFQEGSFFNKLLPIFGSKTAGLWSIPASNAASSILRDLYFIPDIYSSICENLGASLLRTESVFLRSVERLADDPPPNGVPIPSDLASELITDCQEQAQSSSHQCFIAMLTGILSHELTHYDEMHGLQHESPTRFDLGFDPADSEASFFQEFDADKGFRSWLMLLGEHFEFSPCNRAVIAGVSAFKDVRLFRDDLLVANWLQGLPDEFASWLRGVVWMADTNAEHGYLREFFSTHPTDLERQGSFTGLAQSLANDIRDPAERARCILYVCINQYVGMTALQNIWDSKDHRNAILRLMPSQHPLLGSSASVARLEKFKNAKHHERSKIMATYHEITGRPFNSWWNNGGKDTTSEMEVFSSLMDERLDDRDG